MGLDDGTSPNWTPEQLEGWRRRGEGQHPDQLAQERENEEEDSLFRRTFPYDVVVDLSQVADRFGPPDEAALHPIDHPYESRDWVDRWRAWMVENFGPECTNWDIYRLTQYVGSRGRDGAWVNISSHVFFADETHAAMMRTMFGGGSEWE